MRKQSSEKFKRIGNLFGRRQNWEDVNQTEETEDTAVEQEKLAKGEGAKLIRRRSIKIAAAVFVIAAIIVSAAIIMLRTRNTEVLNKPAYMVINGNRIEYPNGIKLYHDDKGTVIVKKDGTACFDEFPIMSESGNEIILQRSGIWYKTTDDTLCRVDYYTDISKDGMSITISKGNKQESGDSGFIYDNNNTYIFLEPADLSWNNKKQKISPMTTIQVVSGQTIQIVEPGKEPVFEDLEGEDVSAVFSDGKRLNLSMDRYYMANGSWRLIFLPIDELPGM